MEAKELRIGNDVYKFGIDYIGDNPIVDKNDFEIIKVDIDVLKNIDDFDGTTNFYYTEPIPLTEEILLKCGFEKEEDSNCYFNQIALYFTFDKITCNISYYEYDNLINVDYLHQLQNLYFALTNEELNINL